MAWVYEIKLPEMPETLPCSWHFFAVIKIKTYVLRRVQLLNKADSHSVFNTHRQHLQ